MTEYVMEKNPLSLQWWYSTHCIFEKRFFKRRKLVERLVLPWGRADGQPSCFEIPLPFIESVADTTEMEIGTFGYTSLYKISVYAAFRWSFSKIGQKAYTDKMCKNEKRPQANQNPSHFLVCVCMVPLAQKKLQKWNLWLLKLLFCRSWQACWIPHSFMAGDLLKTRKSPIFKTD